MRSAGEARQPGFLLFPLHSGSGFREVMLDCLLRWYGNPVCFSDEYDVSLPFADAWRDDRFCSVMLIGAHDLWAPMARRPFMGFRLSLDYDGERFLPRAVVARKGMVPAFAMAYLLRSNMKPDGRLCLDQALDATRATFVLFCSGSWKGVAEPESHSVFRQ